MYAGVREPGLNRRGFLLLCCALVLLWTPGGRADLLQKGDEAIRRGHPEEAYELFSRAAEAGDPVGEYGLGVLFLHGIGVTQDPAWATRRFRAAAERDYPPAQLNLGNAYLYARGVSRDPAEAEKWWRRAARLGYAPARFNLGVLLLDEASSAGLREEGIAWIRAAAQQGMEKARERLQALGEPLEFPPAWAEPEREPQRSEGRLMTPDPGGFTIQVLTARLTATARRFVAQQGLDGRAGVFQFPYQGGLWSGVVVGWYATPEQAQLAGEGLVQTLEAAELWYRPVDDVQRQILAARRVRKKTETRPSPGD